MQVCEQNLLLPDMFDHLLRGPKKDEHLALEETPDGAHVAWTGRDRATRLSRGTTVVWHD